MLSSDDEAFEIVHLRFLNSFSFIYEMIDPVKRLIRVSKTSGTHSDERRVALSCMEPDSVTSPLNLARLWLDDTPGGFNSIRWQAQDRCNWLFISN